ncbi:phospholipase D-like domain-containing protein [Clostridium tarantellae]|uniref:PLD phosphodiesterase domain-containing protein n=1 Tax=Clostridium tarantellae TaxID=39493 RepID=A0A6I1MNV5_9CLOT|nr:phospholipase D-like domain-containing protein [Clostridium tarantellae]MPQ44453.1 hypothetical protein [Clostridium tarantellae]
MNNFIDDIFNKNKNFEMGIFCTYSFNTDFFENYILNLKGVNTCRNISIFTDREMYNNSFNAGEMTKPKWINKKYLVTPIDTNGVFHPKLYLLASEKSVSIGVGSANLTREGLASNLEIISTFEVTEKNKKYSGLLKECLEFLRELSLYSNSASAIKSVDTFINYTSHLLSEEKSEIRFLNNFNEAILPTIVKELEDNTVNNIKVISPFYDKELEVYKYLRNIYHEAKIDIFVQQKKSNFPTEKYNYFDLNTSLYVYMGQDRYMHGKAIVFDTNKGRFLLTGSTNFTKSALLDKEFKANIETAIWGNIDEDIVNNLIKPNGVTITKLNNIKELNVTKIDNKSDSLKERLIYNWLIEALNDNNTLRITLNNEQDIMPVNLIFNGDEDNKIDFRSEIVIKDISKKNLEYVQVEGINNENIIVKSSSIWIIKLEKDREYTVKKSYSIDNPYQITSILNELIENGSEQELIEYLLRFNIPLDLVLFNGWGRGLSASESKGNVFGELVQQNKSIFKNNNIFDATQKFLKNNYEKLNIHYENIQLNKLDNMMLIYGTIFNMMSVFNGYIINLNNSNEIEADNWVIIRKYYDIMLKYIEKVLTLIWKSEEYYTFQEQVNKMIKKDKQKTLLNISSFKEFIIKRDYEYQYKLSLDTSKDIIFKIDEYITKFKVKNKNGNLVKPFISQNGMKDIYINKRENILSLVDSLITDFNNWHR